MTAHSYSKPSGEAKPDLGRRREEQAAHDVIVIGFGGAGACAVIQAADELD